MTMYDGKAFAQAARRFFATPTELTEADIAQLALVDPALEAGARAKPGRLRQEGGRFRLAGAEGEEGPRSPCLAKWHTDFFLVVLASAALTA